MNTTDQRSFFCLSNLQYFSTYQSQYEMWASQGWPTYTWHARVCHNWLRTTWVWFAGHNYSDNVGLKAFFVLFKNDVYV